MNEILASENIPYTTWEPGKLGFYNKPTASMKRGQILH